MERIGYEGMVIPALDEIIRRDLSLVDNISLTIRPKRGSAWKLL